jgi:hypothetical protein
VILVTGASGALGGLVFQHLTTVPGVDVVAGSRSPDAGARRIDFDQASTLVDGFGASTCWSSSRPAGPRTTSCWIATAPRSRRPPPGSGT